MTFFELFLNINFFCDFGDTVDGSFEIRDQLTS